MISVIVPAYNVENTISETLDSILSQTYKEIEIIVVDDGSNDKTGKIIDQYEALYVQVRAIHTINRGVTAARLAGVEVSTGEWIGFVDGDDEIEPDMYERLLNNAQKYHADISHCGYQMVFEDGRVNYFYNTGRLMQQDKLTGLLDLLDGSFIEPGLWNKLFHKKLFHGLLHCNQMDKSIKINEDLLMNYYLFEQANISVFEDFCPYNYIVRSTSVSRQMLNEYKIYDPIRVKKIILDTASSELKEKAKQVYLSTCINTYNSIVLSETFKFDIDRRCIRKIIVSNWSYFHLLTKRQRLLAFLIRYMPVLYKPIYRIYATHFLKNPYL